MFDVVLNIFSPYKNLKFFQRLFLSISILTYQEVQNFNFLNMLTHLRSICCIAQRVRSIRQVCMEARDVNFVDNAGKGNSGKGMSYVLLKSRLEFGANYSFAMRNSIKLSQFLMCIQFDIESSIPNYKMARSLFIALSKLHAMSPSYQIS